MHTTSLTLLNRLRGPRDADAWDRFVRLYSAGLYSWIRGHGFRHDDAADLVQDVFTTLVQKLADFEHTRGGSFRAWLWTITRNKCREHVRRRRPVSVPGEVFEGLEGDPGIDVSAEDFRRELMRRVAAVLEAEFPPDVWRAFWAHVVEEHPASRVAAEQGINIWAVYTAKARVLARLNEELADLAED
ncbi:MAG: sigma-70 family RNA polymerase sigma factor [Planctomycetes bacterium]|nr:sigma-70 family RNA polymerase sigma factor [Planctomycetota bacterium]